MHTLTPLSVDKILLPRYMIWFTNFRSLLFDEQMVSYWLKPMKALFTVTNSSLLKEYCLITESFQKIFTLSSKKKYILFIIQQKLCSLYHPNKRYSIYHPTKRKIFALSSNQKNSEIFNRLKETVGWLVGWLVLRRINFFRVT